MRRPPKTALITGAASGIGRAFARECARRNMSLVLVDLNEAGMLETADIIRLESQDCAIHTVTMNLAEHDSPDKCLEFCDRNHIQVDFLINNAGVFFFDPLVEASKAKVETMCGLHVYCVTRMSQLFAARMKARGFGYVLNVSSMSAWMAMPGIGVYNASKSYIRNLSNSMYFELKPHNVCVTAVCPGGINTTLFGLSEKLRRLATKLRILMTPETLAKKSVSAALKGKKQTIPGIFNHIAVLFILLLPDFLVFFIMRRLDVYRRFLKAEDAAGAEPAP